MRRLQDYKQFMEVKSLMECNQLLNQGWECHKVIERTTEGQIIYCMGLPKKEV